MRFCFRPVYFSLACALFAIEVLIALFVRDAVVRPYIGDVLVVILMYTALRSFLDVRVLPTAIGVLLFAYLIEFLQHQNLLVHLGWRHSRLANIVLGNSFAWLDMLAYTGGIALVLIAERRRY